MAQGEIQTALTGGEFSPSLYARVDLAKYEIGAALIRNYFVDYRGGVSNRPGTKYIDDLTTYVLSYPPKLIPFIVSTDASYVCVFTDLLVSIYSRGIYITSVTTPYRGADFAQLKYAQSADVLTIVHPLHPPANLTRTSDTTFTYDIVTIGPKIAAPIITAMRAPHSGPYDFGYLMTAVDLDGKEESVASNIGVMKSEGMDATNNRVIGLDGTPPPEATSKFNFYKWGPVDAATMVPATQWGFIGSANIPSFTDNNIAPDFAKQPPQWGDPFSGGQIQSISVTAGGSGYAPTDWPSIPFVPLHIVGDGTGAAGYAVVDVNASKIIGAYLTNPGKDYTTATVTATGESGSGATFALTFSDPTPVYPATVTYIQQRRTFGGANSKPETLVMSQTGLYNNFNSTPATLDTDAITVSIASLQINTIKAFVPTSYGLLVLTTGGSFLINGGTPGASITPSSITAQAQASNGANDLPPLVINYDILYGQNKGNRIRNLAFAWQRQSYTGSDISALAIHLFDDHSTVDWCWAEEPFKLVWLVRDDGRLLSCTYVPDQEVNAWARHDTQGFVRSICSVPEDAVNAVYLVVERFIPPTPTVIRTSYTSEEHTATLARWTNMLGLTWSPDKKAVVWFADAASAGQWEAWNNVTRTYISSGTFPSSGGWTPPIAPKGQNTAALTNDHYMYVLAGPDSAHPRHLVRYANYGAGSQEDKGDLTALSFGNSDGISAALLAGDGNTYIGIKSFSTSHDGMLYCHNTGTPPILLDTSLSTGVNWQIKWFLCDGHGDVWALGGLGDLAANKLAFWRIVNTSGISRTDYFTVTMPAAVTGGLSSVYGCHSLAGDHFIIAWPSTGVSPFVVTIDYAGTITHTITAAGLNDPYFEPVQMANFKPSDPTILLSGGVGALFTRYNCLDLSINTTYEPDLWGYGDTGVVQSGMVYDPLNNALFVGLQNANQNFAYLFFPTTSSVCDGWKWYLERMDNRLSDCVEDSWFLDCATRVPLTSGTGHFLLNLSAGDAVLTFCP